MTRRPMSPRPEFTPAVGEAPLRERRKLHQRQQPRSNRQEARRESFGPASEGMLKTRLLRATNRSPLATMDEASRERVLEQAANEEMWKSQFAARRRLSRAERRADRRAARRKAQASRPTAQAK